MNEKKRTAQLLSADSIFGYESVEPHVALPVEADIGDLYPFKKHPFQVRDDEEMDALTESIEQNGILVPLIVRPRKPRGYEIIAGHRRKHGAKRAGLKRVPIDIRDVDDDTAILMMVNSNVQREKVLPSERAFAYRMMLEVIKRQGERNDLTSAQIGPKLRSNDELAENVGISRNQIKRYIRLTFLIDVLLLLVDHKKMPLNAGVELSYLSQNDQQMLFDVMNKEDVKPTIAQAVRLKEEAQINPLTKEKITLVLSSKAAEKATWPQIKLSGATIKRYFPPDYTQDEVEKVIISLLDKWLKEKAD